MYKKAWNLIDRSKHIVLISHINPDADALGSSLALYPILKEMGKKVSVVNMTRDLPKRYDFLPNFKKIKSALPQNFDLIVSFDCGSLDRLGISKQDIPIINVDHHKTNTLYADINLIDTTAASASCVVLNLLKENEIALRRDVATCIYAALVEDTGFFSYENVKKETFETAASLVEAKADPVFIARMLNERNSLSKLRLISIMTQKLQLVNFGMVGYAILSLNDFRKSGALRSDSDECVDKIRSLATVELAILLIEESKGYKISLRSKEKLDVSQIASFFGGGGHKRAAGFTINHKDEKKIIIEIINKAGI